MYGLIKLYLYRRNIGPIFQGNSKRLLTDVLLGVTLMNLMRPYHKESVVMWLH